MNVRPDAVLFVGQQALELGLADKLGTLEYVAREVVKQEEIVDYTRRDNVAERLAKKFGAAVGEGAMKAIHAIGGAACDSVKLDMSNGNRYLRAST